MSPAGFQMRCQRCGTAMDMRDPVPGGVWKPDQFWVCPKCGRHFWTTYPKPPEPKPPEPRAPAPEAPREPEATP